MGCSPWGPKRVGHDLALNNKEYQIQRDRRMVVSRVWAYDKLVFNGALGSVGKDRKVLEMMMVDCCSTM